MSDEKNGRGERATWAAVLGLLTAAAGSGCTGYCGPQTFPAGHPCEGKGPCDIVPVQMPADAGFASADGGPVEGGMFCGCCNG